MHDLGPVSRDSSVASQAQALPLPVGASPAATHAAALALDPTLPPEVITSLQQLATRLVGGILHLPLSHASSVLACMNSA